jgi:hypothetical protein
MKKKNQKPFCRRRISFYFTFMSLEHEEMRTSHIEGERSVGRMSKNSYHIMTSYTAVHI